MQIFNANTSTVVWVNLINNDDAHVSLIPNSKKIPENARNPKMPEINEFLNYH